MNTPITRDKGETSLTIDGCRYIADVELGYGRVHRPADVGRDVANSQLGRAAHRIICLLASSTGTPTTTAVALTITRLSERVLLAPKIIQHRHSEERLKEGFSRFQQARLGTSHGLHGIDTSVCLQVQCYGCLRIEDLRNSGRFAAKAAGWRRGRIHVCVCVCVWLWGLGFGLIKGARDC